MLLVVSFHVGLGLPEGVTRWIGKHVSNTLAGSLMHGPPGGFVGVDIFFVISGYLISGILLRELQAGTFSIAKFYERRVRRILPALTAVLLFTWLVGYFALPPAEMLDLNKSMLAAALSAGNFYFWNTSGYFDLSSLQKPLLHTWSLAVEEQFYLVFPVLLLLLHRFARSYLKLGVVLMALASFVASVLLVYHHPVAAFYLPHTRAWELLLGTIVALDMIRSPRSRWARNLLSASGLGLILYAALHYNPETLFPGAAALAPCVGAALLIHAHRNGSSLVGSILAWRPVVVIGMMSYSLYLWHWPLLLIHKYEYFDEVRFSKPLLFVVMLVFATLSWRFVEQPFRSGVLKLPRRQLFAAATAAVAVLAALNLWGIGAKGIPSRFSSAQLNLARAEERGPLDAQWGKGCFASTDHAPIWAKCLTESHDKPNYLLFGDSHAAHLWYGFSTIFPQVHWLEATASQCPPLLSGSTSRDAFCRELIATVSGFLLSHRVDGVVLSADWREQDIPALSKTIAALHAANLRVYVVGPNQKYDQALSSLLIRADRSHDATLPTRHLIQPDVSYKSLDEQMAAASLASGATHYLSLRQLLCPSGQCIEYVAPNVPLIFDVSHLTNKGSLFVAQKLRQANELPEVAASTRPQRRSRL